MKTLVFFCRCAGNISGRMDEERLLEAVRELEGTSEVETAELLCSPDGQSALKEKLAESRPDRVVIAACSPRDHEATFQRALREAGMNPYLMQMTNIREMVAWVTADRDRATEKALSYIRAAVERSAFQEELETIEIEMDPRVLVLGAGPAGMRAALSLSEAGREVCLVERNAHVGGKPVLFEEVAPSMECGPCMLEPVMDEVLQGEHSVNIELMRSSELINLAGFFGNFIATIRRAPEHVSEESCIGCGECVEACPQSYENAINCGLDSRKAISMPFAGALPNVPVISPAHCLRLGAGEACRACLDACPIEGTIDLEAEESIEERKIGAVVVATGSDVYPVSDLPFAGGGGFPEIHSGLGLERLLSANGPTGGKLEKRDGTPPSSVAIVHCAGSMEKAHRDYCSGTCCQSAFKFNRMISRALPDCRVHHLVKEIVTPGKGARELYKKARENPNSTFIRFTDTSELSLSESGGGMIELKTGGGEKIEADMLILMTPMVAEGSAAELRGILDIPAGEDGFFEELHDMIDRTRSKLKGIYLAGSCRGPMDIGQAVDEGAAAAGQVLSGLKEGRKLQISPVRAEVVETERCGSCGICWSVCPYQAIGRDPETGKTVIQEVLCQGCGTCVAACPSGALGGRHFSSEQIRAELRGLLS